MLAIRNFQRKVGMEPADGYAWLEAFGAVASEPLIRLRRYWAGGLGESADWG